MRLCHRANQLNSTFLVTSFTLNKIKYLFKFACAPTNASTNPVTMVSALALECALCIYILMHLYPLKQPPMIKSSSSIEPFSDWYHMEYYSEYTTILFGIYRHYTEQCTLNDKRMLAYDTFSIVLRLRKKSDTSHHNLSDLATKTISLYRIKQ